MVMPRSWLTSPARTRMDRRLRNRIVMVFLATAVLLYGGLFVSGLLPPVLRDYVALPVLVVLYLVAAALLSWRKADWQNRATYSKDDAHSRHERARILGGDDQ